MTVETAVRRAAIVAAGLISILPPGSAQSPSSQTIKDYECITQTAEERMASRKTFLLVDTDSALKNQLIRSDKIATMSPGGSNPRKITGGMVYDWAGTVFIRGVSLDRVIRMLQDYDHRAQYFPEVIASSKLLCRRGEDRFGFVMRMKEPAVMDVESDVVWERMDPQRWKCRSYSTRITEVGGNHRYLQRLYSYWRFSAESNGVFVEGETLTLSGQFNSLMRAMGSMMGINPEKSLRKTLTEMRDSALKSSLQLSPPANAPDCGEQFRPTGCAQVTQR